MSDGLTDQRFRPKIGTMTVHSGPSSGIFWATEPFVPCVDLGNDGSCDILWCSHGAP